MISLLPLLLLVLLVSGTPLQRRATTACDQYSHMLAGPYLLNTELWGEGTATPGWQCSTLDSVNDNIVSWHTSWTWTGLGVKSFSSISLNEGIDQQLSSITSIPTTWRWSQVSSRIVVADVAYDMLTSTTPGGSAVNEIMIWLGDYNVRPVSSHYNFDGWPLPVRSELLLGGHIWNLYSGSNGANQVYSFVPANGIITSFSTDIYPFLLHLMQHQGIDSSQYLTNVQAGTKTTSGSAIFTTLAYSLTINSGDHVPLMR
ncbi:glycoside hydrolase family 12 protein [Gyrodon lividus]|nr:glycoside hydrolase family 12 protein [Gyrodon lividus]